MQTATLCDSGVSAVSIQTFLEKLPHLRYVNKPIAVSNWVRQRSDINATAKLVFEILADQAYNAVHRTRDLTQRLSCSMSVSQISRRVGATESTVRAALRSLQKVGMLDRQTADVVTKRGTPTARNYLNIPLDVLDTQDTSLVRDPRKVAKPEVGEGESIVELDQKGIKTLQTPKEAKPAEQAHVSKSKKRVEPADFSNPYVRDFNAQLLVPAVVFARTLSATQSEALKRDRWETEEGCKNHFEIISQALEHATGEALPVEHLYKVAITLSRLPALKSRCSGRTALTIFMQAVISKLKTYRLESHMTVMKLVQMIVAKGDAWEDESIFIGGRFSEGLRRIAELGDQKEAHGVLPSHVVSCVRLHLIELSTLAYTHSEDAYIELTELLESIRTDYTGDNDALLCSLVPNHIWQRDELEQVA